MAGLTKEWLKLNIETLELEYSDLKPSAKNELAAYKIALAAMEAPAEPVYQAQYGEHWRDLDKVQYDDHVKHETEGLRILYSAPPAIPQRTSVTVAAEFDSWFESVLRPAMAINQMQMAERKMVYSAAQLTWSACCAAMLDGRAEPVASGEWITVPKNPTWEMLSEDGCKEHHNGQECLHHDNRRRIWRAMLKVAPQLPKPTADLREVFEAWAKSNCWNVERGPTGAYISMCTHDGWTVVSACRDAIIAAKGDCR